MLTAFYTSENLSVKVLYNGNLVNGIGTLIKEIPEWDWRYSSGVHCTMPACALCTTIQFVS